MKTCLLSGNFALDTIVTRDYPNGFVIGKNNKFTETIVTECVGNTCGNVASILPYLGVQTFPIAHLDLSEQGFKIKDDLQRYGADVRFVENSIHGGTTLLRCTHKRDKTTGEHTVSFRSTSPGSRFPKRRFLRVRDEAPTFMENLEFTPDIFFFDAAEAGLRYLASELRKRGTMIYFEPESDADKNKFLKAVEISDIIKFSHEKISDMSFTNQYDNKLFIRTLGAEGLEFNLCNQGWRKVTSVHNDNVVDWEGAGDWTTSQFIACLCEKEILSISQTTIQSVRECLEIACQTASSSVSYLGSKGMIDAKISITQ
jgi:sugar/nucleoside kinase (ribokinase family)